MQWSNCCFWKAFDQNPYRHLQYKHLRQIKWIINNESEIENAQSLPLAASPPAHINETGSSTKFAPRRVAFSWLKHVA